MNYDKKALIECVPNFSEGRKSTIIKGIGKVLASTSEVNLLHIDTGVDANRTVYTLIGAPNAVVEAIVHAAKYACTHIDMTIQRGVHPRLGVLDVCPLIPLRNISKEDLLPYAVELSDRLGKELGIPTFLYEHSSTDDYRRNLANIRKGEYEGLEQKMLDPLWHADNGVAFNRKTGATVLGVRDFLIAYNVNLDTKEVSIAKQIAGQIRETGHKVMVNEVKTQVAGSLIGVKAIGWFMEEFNCAQISTNIVDVAHKGMHDVFEAVKTEALNIGVSVTGSELIGMVPVESALLSASFYGLDMTNKAKAIDHLGEILGLQIKLSDRIIW
jgi:glutamate formiminotransferase/formiminotetrahydrofolate cyclodeaminase